jgi:hypothetical protein
LPSFEDLGQREAIDPIVSYRAWRRNYRLSASEGDVGMDDLTKDLWRGTAERVLQRNPVDPPSSLVAESPPPVSVETGWRDFLVSRKLGAIYALACILGLLAIVTAHPFASPSASQRVSDKLGQPATCSERGAIVTADSRQAIYRCAVGKGRSAKCFAVSGADIRQVSGRRELGC